MSHQAVASIPDLTQAGSQSAIGGYGANNNTTGNNPGGLEKHGSSSSLIQTPQDEILMLILSGKYRFKRKNEEEKNKSKQAKQKLPPIKPTANALEQSGSTNSKQASVNENLQPKLKKGYGSKSAVTLSKRGKSHPQTRSSHKFTVASIISVFDKRFKSDPSRFAPIQSNSNNAFMKIANFLVEKEELDEKDLEVIVEEINKQEGEFKDRSQAKHKFAEYSGKHKYHKHTKESHVLDSMNKHMQRSGSFLLQSSSEVYKQQPRDSQGELHRGNTHTQLLHSEHQLPGSVQDQPLLPSQKQLTTSSQHKDRERGGSIVRKGDRRDTGLTVSNTNTHTVGRKGSGRAIAKEEQGTGWVLQRK